MKDTRDGIFVSALGFDGENLSRPYLSDDKIDLRSVGFFVKREGVPFPEDRDELVCEDIFRNFPIRTILSGKNATNKIQEADIVKIYLWSIRVFPGPIGEIGIYFMEQK